MRAHDCWSRGACKRYLYTRHGTGSLSSWIKHWLVFGLAPVEYRNCICRDLTDLAILPRVTYHVPTSRIYCRSASSLFSTFDFEQLTCYVTRHGKTSRSHQAKYIPSIFQKRHLLLRQLPLSSFVVITTLSFRCSNCLESLGPAARGPLLMTAAPWVLPETLVPVVVWHVGLYQCRHWRFDQCTLLPLRRGGSMFVPAGVWAFGV